MGMVSKENILAWEIGVIFRGVDANEKNPAFGFSIPFDELEIILAEA